MIEPARLPDSPFLYVLTDEVAGGARPAELARRLFAAGVAVVQLRAKGLDDRAYLREAEEAAGYAADARGVLVVNDRADVALAAGAGALHLGDRDLPPAAVRRLGGARLLIGVSTHSVAEAAEADRAPVDYVALGPVYASRNKAEREPLGVEALVEARARVSKPLVAIGGIDRSRVAEVVAAGADGVAVIAAAYDGGVEAGVSRLRGVLAGAGGAR